MDHHHLLISYSHSTIFMAETNLVIRNLQNPLKMVSLMRIIGMSGSWYPNSGTDICLWYPKYIYQRDEIKIGKICCRIRKRWYKDRILQVHVLNGFLCPVSRKGYCISYSQLLFVDKSKEKSRGFHLRGGRWPQWDQIVHFY